ncbi:FAD/NAD(P)-binding domain-containing protein [Backusella circina FSU 941]|nr:FAD/NAD(P)-binding domain-containing protein [Backusella circina FSU 941]
MTLDQKVIIIGAGLGGLVVAHACQSQNIPYELFERDSSSESRTQGWSISLHMAIDSIKNAVTFPGAFDHFGKRVSVNREDPDGIAFSFIDGLNDEIIYHVENKLPGDSYRIHRKRFRDWLISGLNPEKVHWSKKFSRYVSDKDSVTVCFDDDTSVKGGILVAADGALSSVCNQLVGGQEQFDKMTLITPVRSFAVDSWVSVEEWEKFRAFSNCFGMVTGTDQRDGSSSNLFWAINDTDFNRKDGKPIQMLWAISKYDSDQVIPHYETNGECLKALKDWAQNSFKEDGLFQRMILETPDDAQVFQFTIRERTPTLETLATDKRVFLVGDAAHCMTMFRGEGGNHAMLDSGNLGTQLGLYYNGEKELDAIHQDYYNEMSTRGAKAVADSHEAAISFHLHRERMITIFKTMQRHINQ